VLPESFDTNDYLGELEKLGIRREDLDVPGLVDPPAPTT
jgi:hypothetical protein